LAKFADRVMQSKSDQYNELVRMWDDACDVM